MQRYTAIGSSVLGVLLGAAIITVIITWPANAPEPKKKFNPNLHWISSIDTLRFEKKLSREDPNLGWGLFGLEPDSYDECIRIYSCDSCDYKSWTEDEDYAKWRPLWFKGWSPVLDTTWHDKMEFRLTGKRLDLLYKILDREQAGREGTIIDTFKYKESDKGVRWEPDA